MYILRSLKNGKYYIGSTKDMAQRLIRHNAGKTKGNRNNRPFEIAYHEVLVLSKMQ
jgi:putative endonuclease